MTITTPIVTHTPGPWTIEPDYQVRAGVFRIGQTIGYAPGEPEKVWEANARLIAAAPDLLVVCQRFLEMYDDVRDRVGPSVRAAIEHAERTIAKIEGGAR